MISERFNSLLCGLLALFVVNDAFARECMPLTGPAPFAFAIELNYQTFGEACARRFPEYRNEVAILYPDWKLVAAEHIDIGRCHYEKTVEAQQIELRESIAAAGEVMISKQLEQIAQATAEIAWSPCRWQLRMFKYKPGQPIP